MISNTSDDYHTEIFINDFKAHVKRDFVNIGSINRYFDSLIYATNSAHEGISTIALSCVCHLVKRVSMQHPWALKQVSKTVLPLLLTKLGDSRPAAKSASRKALHAFWTSAPNEVETEVRVTGLHHKDWRVINECLIWLIGLIHSNQNFIFKPFTSTVVSLLLYKHKSVVESAETLLVNFFGRSTNKSAKHDLIKELRRQNVPKDMALSLVNEIDRMLIPDYLRQDSFVDSASTRVTASLKNRPPSSRMMSSSPAPVSASLHLDAGNDSANKRLDQILGGLNAYSPEVLSPVDFSNEEDFACELESFLPIFSGKETEFNWQQREKNIISLRHMLRGNATREFSQALSQGLRQMCDAISKAISSLRTTLSAHGCQLAKECGIFFGSHLDSFTIDSLSSTLIRLTSSTKKIASQKATTALCALVANTPYSPKLLSMLCTAAVDKNFQPRLYASDWLIIVILTHSTKNRTGLEISGIEGIAKCVLKGLSDQHPQVRESMRKCFWVIDEFWPTQASQISEKLETNVKKALERTRPTSAVSELLPKRSASRSHRSSLNESLSENLGKPCRVVSQPRRLADGRQPFSRTRSEEVPVKQVGENRPLKEIFSSRPSSRQSTHDDVFESVPISQKTPESVKELVHRRQKQEREEQTYSFLSSSEFYKQKEGIKLVGYSFMSGEALSIKFNEVLDNLSIAAPTLFQPLLKEEFIDETARYLTCDNLLRTLGVVLAEGEIPLLENSFVSKMMENVSLQDVCLSASHLLASCVSLSEQEDPRIAMIVIKYKRQLVSFVVRLLLMIIQGPLPDFLLSNLLERVMPCIELVSESESENFRKLLEVFRSKNSDIFYRCLEAQVDPVNNEICRLLGIQSKAQQTLDLESNSDSDDMMIEGVNASSLFEMTMIHPGGSVNAEQSGNEDTNYGMTMIVPNLHRLNKMEVDNDHLNLHSAVKTEAGEGIVTGMNTVRICSDSDEQEKQNDLEKMVDSAGPLAQEPESISVYKDMDQMSWFKLQVSFLCETGEASLESLSSLSNGELSTMNVSSLLHLCQNESSEIDHWFRSEGSRFIQSTSFNELSHGEKILFLTVCGASLFSAPELFQAIWSEVSVSDIPRCSDELFFATMEVGQRCASINPSEVLTLSLQRLKDGVSTAMSVCLLGVVIDCVKQIRTDDDVVIRVNESAAVYLDHEDASVRMACTQLYANLVSLCGSHSKENCDVIYSKLNAVQQKLVRYHVCHEA